MSDELTFSITERFDRTRLLNEAAEVILYADVPMGASAQEDPDEEKQRAVGLLRRLSEERASFSPKLDVYHFSSSDFKKRDTTVAPEFSSKMREYDYYQISVPVTLFPKSGWAFTRLECALEFCPGEPQAHLRPVAHDIFPDDIWADIFALQDSLSVGIDESLTFRAALADTSGKWRGLSGDARAKLALDMSGRMKLVVGPFTYRARRAQVRARGRGNAEMFWRLDGNEHVDEEDVTLGIVLAVPKSRKKEISAVGALKAYHSFQLFSAELKDWMNDFPKVVRSLISGGVPVEATCEWTGVIEPR